MIDRTEATIELDVDTIIEYADTPDELAPPAAKVARLFSAVANAHRKHVQGDLSIGWRELSEQLTDTLCEVMGDERFQEWLQNQDYTNP